jgi:general stress protein YciG
MQMLLGVGRISSNLRGTSGGTDRLTITSPGRDLAGGVDQKEHSMSQHSGNPGNFAEDREKASEAGRKGGQHSHSGGDTASHAGGGEASHAGNFARDREQASEAGKKGGQHSHGGRS